MSTTEVIWTVAIVLVALIVIGLIVSSMRKKSLADNHARAEQLRGTANTSAAGLLDAKARAEQAEVQAEHKRLEAQRAEEQAAIARTEVDQQQALQEDRIRSADRLDPEVDHRAKDYSPEVAAPVGPVNVPTDPAHAEPESGRAPEPVTGSPTAAEDGSSVTLEPTDTSPRDTTVGTDDETLRNRLEGDAPDETGGTHRA